jgi:hypothetical protein
VIQPGLAAAAAAVLLGSAAAGATLTVIWQDNAGTDDARVTCDGGAIAHTTQLGNNRYGLTCVTATPAAAARVTRVSPGSSTPPPTVAAALATMPPRSTTGARAAAPQFDTAPAQAAPAPAAPEPARQVAPEGNGVTGGGSGTGGGNGTGGGPTGAATAAPAPTAAVARQPTATPRAGAAEPENDGNFCSDQTPLGAIAPAVPEWCALPQTPPRPTFDSRGNSWSDDWQHGSSHGALGNMSDGYAAGAAGEQCGVLHFRHNNHWMVDIAGDGGQHDTECGAWLRPDRTFQLQDGRLVVEMEVASPIAGTRSVDSLGDSWPELVISTASRTTRASDNSWASPFRRNGSYLYEAFPRAWTFGCRMQQSRRPICALYNDGEGTAGGADRQWEINQNGTDVRFESGGDPAVAGIASSWKSCTSVDDPDTVCRNVFRFEFYKDGAGTWVLDIYSNGTLYYRAGLPDNLLDNVLAAPGGFYVYFGEMAYRLGPGEVVRFHWDRIAVNP